MFKFNKADRNALMSITFLFMVICVLAMTRGPASKYQPRPIKIKTVSEKSIFELENKVECTPGYKDGSAYTKSLTPGGLCGAQGLVSDLAGYEIEEGIGGSLI
jgi:hypothetical protein